MSFQRASICINSNTVWFYLYKLFFALLSWIDPNLYLFVFFFCYFTDNIVCFFVVGWTQFTIRNGRGRFGIPGNDRKPLVLSTYLDAQEHLPYADDSNAVTPMSEENGAIIVPVYYANMGKKSFEEIENKIRLSNSFISFYFKFSPPSVLFWFSFISYISLVTFPIFFFNFAIYIIYIFIWIYEKKMKQIWLAQ